MMTSREWSRGTRAAVLALVSGAMVAGCGDEGGASTDAGAVDVSTTDNGQADVSVDVGVVDAGAVDTGVDRPAPNDVVDASPSQDVVDAAMPTDVALDAVHDASTTDVQGNDVVATDVVATDVTATDNGPTDSGVVDAGPASPPAVTVLAPMRDFSETRRLFYATVTDDEGIAEARYSVNSGTAVTIATTGAPRTLTIAEALTLRTGPNTLVLTLVDTRGATRTETIAFRYGATTAGGGSHSGAIIGGRFFVFGRNNTMQLGLNTTDTSRTTPVEMPAFGATGTTPSALAFNQNFSLALRSDGTVWTWGDNANGELGQGDMGTTTRRNTPTRVGTIDDATYAALGYNHALLLRGNGQVFAWGQNALGQVGVVGDGTSTDRQLAPVAVTGLPTGLAVVKVIAGSSHSAALGVDGRVYVWGRNQYGNLGLGTTDTMRHPMATVVPGLTGVIDIANGRDHLLAVRADGTVASWGLGASGQLGYGENTMPDMEDRTSPVTVMTTAEGTMPLTNVAAVFANGNTSFAVLRNGQLWGWGENGNGTLATGGAGGSGALANKAWFAIRVGVVTVATETTPAVYFDTAHPIRAMAVGALHVVATTATPELYTWGWSTQGTLGVASFPATWRQPSPALVTLPAVTP